MNQRKTSPTLRLLSLGSGVQSTALLRMAWHGMFPERLDGAIFADTQSEPQGVYDTLEQLCVEAAERHFPIYRVTKGNLGKDVLNALGRTKIGSTSNPPFFVKQPPHAHTRQPRSHTYAFFGTTITEDRPEDNMPPESGGMLWRNCTRDYKVRVITAQCKSLLGYPKHAHIPAHIWIEQWHGLSFDELIRMKPSRYDWITTRYPLIEQRLTRRDCEQWLLAHNYPIPAKSACVFCPYRHDRQWQRMKDESPTDFYAAVTFDTALRAEGKRLPGCTGYAYVHRSCLPLEEVVFDHHAASEQLDAFADECEGHCGV